MKQTWTATIMNTGNDFWGDDPPNYVYVPIRPESIVASSYRLFKSSKKYITFNDYIDMVRTHGKDYVNDRYFFKSRRDAIRYLKQSFPDAHRSGVDNFKFEADIL